MVEAFFKTLKSELVWRTVFLTRVEAREALARYIDGFYHPIRRHSALGFISPPSSSGTLPVKPLSTEATQVQPGRALERAQARVGPAPSTRSHPLSDRTAQRWAARRTG